MANQALVYMIIQRILARTDLHTQPLREIFDQISPQGMASNYAKETQICRNEPYAGDCYRQ